MLTDEVSLVFEIQLDLFLGILDGDESQGLFLRNSVEFRAGTSRSAACGSYRAVGGIAGELGSPEGVHFLWLWWEGRGGGSGGGGGGCGRRLSFGHDGKNKDPESIGGWKNSKDDWEMETHSSSGWRIDQQSITAPPLILAWLSTSPSCAVGEEVQGVVQGRIGS